MDEQDVHVTLCISPDDDVDDNELEAMTYALRKQLLQLSVHQVTVPDGLTPSSGSKSGQSIDLGILLIATAPLIAKQIAGVLEVWIKNRPVRRLTLTRGENQLELNKASAKDQRQAVESFFRSNEQ